LQGIETKIRSTQKDGRIMSSNHHPSSDNEDTAKVNIDKKVKDFLKIRKAVNLSKELDNSKKIEDLKSKVQSGNYNINYEELANRMLKDY
jgi:anti-sigma28 factor (negative regulator of flagellin synthesis)